MAGLTATIVIMNVFNVRSWLEVGLHPQLLLCCLSAIAGALHLQQCAVADVADLCTVDTAVQMLKAAGTVLMDPRVLHGCRRRSRRCCTLCRRCWARSRCTPTCGESSNRYNFDPLLCKTVLNSTCQCPGGLALYAHLRGKFKQMGADQRSVTHSIYLLF